MRTSSARPPSVIFVRGTGRCGSKTLVNCMTEHPALARVPNQCLPEELLDWSDEHLRRRCPGVTDRSIDAGCRAYFEAWARELADPARGRGANLLHKSTANVHRLADLLRIWPDARIVYIVRHPLGVVPAHVAVDLFEYQGAYGYDATVASSALRWYNDVIAYRRSVLFGHPRVIQVRFEDMLADPGEFFAGIYRSLGIDDSPRHVLPGPEEYDERFVLSQRERRWLIDATRGLVADLGYDPDAFSDRVPAGQAGRVERYPQRRLRAAPPTLDGAELLRLAVAGPAAAGARRVGLFGAGYLARLSAPHLRGLAAEVVAVFDDHPAYAGGTLAGAGLPIRRPREAAALAIDTVIPVTLVHQGSMIERWRAASPVPILPLWDEVACVPEAGSRAPV